MGSKWTGRAHAIAALVVAAAVLAGTPAALSASGLPRDYEIVSVDVDGRPATNAETDTWTDNTQAFSRSPVSTDGTRVVFAKSNGARRDADYAPLADDEWCNTAGYCRDIYIRDLVTRSTESVTKHLTVVGAHRFSQPLFSSPWASSADAGTFVFSWLCYWNGSHTETIGGTTFCETPSDDQALVVVDIDTGFTKVLDTFAAGALLPIHLDVSADGGAVLFDRDDPAPHPVACLRPNWTCYDSVPRISLWERGSPPRSIVASQGSVRTGGQDTGFWEIFEARLSGDGSRMFLLVRSTIYGPVDRESWHLFVHEVTGGAFQEIAIPEPVLLTGVSHTGHRVAASADGALYRVDVGAGAVTEVAPLDWCWRAASMTADGRYAGCGSFDGPLRVVDLETGQSIGLGLASEGFVDGHIGRSGPMLSADGSVAMILDHRSPEDDVPGQLSWNLPLQLRVTSLVGDVVVSTPCDYLTATVQGDAGPNVLEGTPGDDVIFGGGGNDELRGNGGDDVLCGGDGSDTLIGGGGNDMLYGGAGDDLLKGQRGTDRSYGGGGDDRLQDGPGNDHLDGGPGRDKLWGAIGQDTLVGGDGNDQLHGDPGDDALDGGPGTDRVWGDAGDDRLFGGDNSDYLYGGIGNDGLWGGAGNDRLFGWDGADELFGEAGRDQLRGQAGDDLVDGGPAYDYCSLETIWRNCEAAL